MVTKTSHLNHQERHGTYNDMEHIISNLTGLNGLEGVLQYEGINDRFVVYQSDYNEWVRGLWRHDKE